jgi:phosphate transport system substrate-binding protein
VKLQRLGILAGIALTATVALAACGTNSNGNNASSNSKPAAGCATGTVNAQGSTAQQNAIAMWIKNYNQKCGSAAKINYNGTGSGAGETAFIQGTADFAGSDSALTPGDQQNQANGRCKTGPAIDLPMVVGPIAVVYNLQGVSTTLQFKPATLAQIFSGKITNWNDPTIAADNSGVKLPNLKITTVHRSDSSGTSANFTNYLSQTAPTDWTFGSNKVWPGPGGDAENGSAGIATELKATNGAIGYVEWSYVTLNSLTMAKIYNGAGEWSALSAQSAGQTIAGAKIVGTGDDLSMNIDYSTNTSGAYPIVLVTYEIVCDKGNSSKTLPLVKSFLEYTASTDGQNALTSVGSAPLPETVRSKVASIVANLS